MAKNKVQPYTLVMGHTDHYSDPSCEIYENVTLAQALRAHERTLLADSEPSDEYYLDLVATSDTPITIR